MPVWIKQGDAVDTRWQVGISLVEATEVRFVAAAQVGGPPVIDKVVTLDEVDPTIVVVRITTEESTEARRLFVEIITTWPDGQIITLPESDYETLYIERDLEGEPT